MWQKVIFNMMWVVGARVSNGGDVMDHMEFWLEQLSR